MRHRQPPAAETAPAAVESQTRRIELNLLGRTNTAAGESRRIGFRVAVEQLAFSGVDGRLRIEPGRVMVMVGTSSDDLPCSAEIELVGSVVSVEKRTRYFTRVEVE